MPEARVLICASAMDAAESAVSLAALQGISLNNAAKVVVTTGKFDTAKAARTFNVEAGYPAYPATLQTYSRSAEVAQWPDQRFRDAYDLINLKRILKNEDGFDIAVLIRDGQRLEARWPALLSELEGIAYLIFAAGEDQTTESLLLNLQAPTARSILDAACDFYLGGRSYAVSPYSLKAVLEIATDAIRFMEELGPLTGASWPRSPIA